MKQSSVPGGLPAPPPGGKARATYESLLAAGERLLRSDGLPALTSTGVAAEAGVATGTFYSYFAGKDELLAALFARGLADIAAAVENVLTADALLDDGLEATLTRAVAAVLRGYREHSTVIRAALGRVPDSALLRELYWARHAEALDVVTRFLRRGAAAGLVRPAPHEPLALATMVVVQGLNHPVLLAGPAREAEAVVAHVARALAALLRPEETDAVPVSKRGATNAS